MNTGFLTPDNRYDVELKNMLLFAKTYLKSQKIALKANAIGMDPSYEYLIRNLNMIQIGTVDSPNFFIKALRNGLGVYSLTKGEEINYNVLLNGYHPLVTSINSASLFELKNLKHLFSTEDGFITRNGILVTYKDCYHEEIAKTILNYLATNNQLLSEILPYYDFSCYTDFLINFLGFIRIRNFFGYKTLNYAPAIASRGVKSLVNDYELLGYRVEEMNVPDKALSKELMRTTKFNVRS